MEKLGTSTRIKRQHVEETIRAAQEANQLAEEKIDKMIATLNGEDEWFLRLQCVKDCVEECIEQEKEGTKGGESGNSLG